MTAIMLSDQLFVIVGRNLKMDFFFFTYGHDDIKNQFSFIKKLEHTLIQHVRDISR